MAYIGNTVENQGFTPAIDYFNGNGVTVTFTLSRPIASVAQVIVAVDNVIQNPSSAFNVVGNSITFTSAPLSGTNNIWVEYTSLITTYQGISQDPTVIGDIRATGGYLAEGDFGNSFIDGAILDYVTGAGRVTVGELDDLIFYHGGTAGRSEMMKVSYAGNSTLVGNLAISGSATIQGLTVGKGGGAVSSNTAFGVNALTANEAGGTNNTAIGNAALDSNTTGDANTALGQDALQANTTASNNTAVGYQAAYSNTTGGITAFGHSALYSNTTATNNTAVGLLAAYLTTTGGSNTALGTSALYSNTAGSTNTAIGQDSLRSNTTASNNTAVGYQAGYSNTGTGPVDAFGSVALYSNTTGTENAAFARQAMQYNTTGSRNVAMGTAALNANTTGSNNTAIGYYCLLQNTTASNNTAVGYQAGYSNTTGTQNTFIGYQAGFSSNYTSGAAYNVALGTGAGYALTTGIINTLIGSVAGNLITTGSKNTIIGTYNGNQGGLDIRTASNYIVLSDGDGNPRVIVDNNGKMRVGGTGDFGTIGAIQSGAGGYCIGTSAANNAGTYYHINFTENGTGRGSITSNGSTTNYATSSDYRLKENIAPMTGALATIQALKPVTYTWKETQKDSQGFIAHELAEVAPDCVVGEKDAVDEEGNPVYQSIDTSFLVATLTAAIQELNAKVEAQALEIATLKAAK